MSSNLTSAYFLCRCVELAPVGLCPLRSVCCTNYLHSKWPANRWWVWSLTQTPPTSEHLDSCTYGTVDPSSIPFFSNHSKMAAGQTVIFLSGVSTSFLGWLLGKCGPHFRPPTSPSCLFSWSAGRPITSLYIVALSLNTRMALKSSGTTCAVRRSTFNRTKLNNWLKSEWMNEWMTVGDCLHLSRSNR